LDLYPSSYPTCSNYSNGINVAEVEFPVYYNYFIKNRKTNIITTQTIATALSVLFHETMFGTPGMDCTSECVDLPEDEIPNLEAECHGLTKFTRPTWNITVEDMLRFTIFNEETRTAQVDDQVSILHEPERDQFVVFENGKAVAIVPSHTSLPEPKLPNSFPSFEPPLFGVTTLGASTGFDPYGITSGLVLWVNRRGIMVDPPPHSSSMLAANGISANLIDTIFLTHCHADHDAGLFQKLMTSKKVTVTTTPTVMKSFLRKYSSVTGLGDDLIKQLFTFRPVTLGKGMFFNGAEVHFHYSLHTIPCIGFRIRFGGKSLYYSADHCYMPSVINELYERGMMKPGRRDFLLKFPHDCDYILHEAGPAPIHTPIDVLESLPPETKKKLYLYHSAKKNVPSSFNYLHTGVDNTIVIDVVAPIFSKSAEILQAVGSIDIFKSAFSFEKAEQMLQMATTEQFAAGSVIIKKGDPGEKFYIITAGVINVLSPENVVKKYTTEDFFGERSLLTGDVCNATVSAETNVTLISIEKTSFLHLFAATDIPAKLLRLADSRQNKSWQAIIDNSIMSGMSSSQKTQLESLLTTRCIPKGTIVWQPDDPSDFAFIIDTGLFLLEEQQIISRTFYDRTKEGSSRNRQSGTEKELKGVHNYHIFPTFANGGLLSDGTASKRGMVDESQKTVVYWGTGGHRGRKHFFAHPETANGWLSVFGHGAMLTELATLSQPTMGKRYTRVTALEDSEVFVISKADFMYFLEKNPSVLVKLHSKSVFIYAFDNVISRRLEKLLIDFVTSGQIHAHPENLLYSAVETLTSFGTDRLSSLVQNFSTEILHFGRLVESSHDRSLRVIIQGQLKATITRSTAKSDVTVPVTPEGPLSGDAGEVKGSSGESVIYNQWEWICDPVDATVVYEALEPTLYLLLPQSRLDLFLDVCSKNEAPSDMGSYAATMTVNTGLRGRVL
jgi:CRP-like cAMP-binding protein/glyoxylase-like metal-dependent hydrolase (beta-lactamase superfamily II)